MIRQIESKSIQDIFSTPIVQQTSFWGNVKKEFGIEALALNFKSRKDDLIIDKLNGLLFNQSGNGYIQTDILILIQNIGYNKTIAYIPYGPETEPLDELSGEFLESLSEQIIPFLPNNCIAIRYDLAWESLWSNDPDYYSENGEWLGPPETRIQELRVNMSTNNWNLQKAPSNILPSNTILLNLKKGENDLLNSMKSKTRYNIKLSQKRGVEVKICSIEQLDIWYDLYTQTAIRNNFHLHPIEYFRVILEEKCKQDESMLVFLLIAFYNNTPLASMFLTLSANRATYLYGASSSENRNLMATYAIQWKAISLAREYGCEIYDMFGVSPTFSDNHPMYGLMRFKSGFGGDIHHSLGCWDYPIDHREYDLFKAMEINNQSYHQV